MVTEAAPHCGVSSPLPGVWFPLSDPLVLLGDCLLLLRRSGTGVWERAVCGGPKEGGMVLLSMSSLLGGPALTLVLTEVNCVHDSVSNSLE